MIKNLTTPTEESAAKALIMLKRMSKLASIIQKASLISRFNSISSAVGPLIIDNIIMKSKLRMFPESIVDKYGN